MILAVSRTLAAGAVLAGICALAAPASAAPRPPAAGSVAAPSLVEQAQVGIYIGPGRRYGGPYYGGPYYRPYPPPYYGPRYYPAPPPGYYYDDEPPPPPPPYSGRYSGDPDAIARCASRFKSFNARTGTYITYDGEERLCPYLR